MGSISELAVSTVMLLPVPRGALHPGAPSFSLLLMHGLLLMTGQHGGRYDPQPVTCSSECELYDIVFNSIANKCSPDAVQQLYALVAICVVFAD